MDSVSSTTNVDIDPTGATSNIVNKTAGGVVSSNSAKYTKDIARTITSLPNISPDWTNRRKLIFQAMYFTGVCIGSIVLVTGVAILHSTFFSQHGFADNNLINLAQNIIYSLVFFASSVVGSYCFAASYEHINYRSNVMDMTSRIATAADKLEREHE